MSKKNLSAKKAAVPQVTVYTPQVKRGIPQFPSISRFIPDLSITSVRRVFVSPAFYFHLTSIIVLVAIAYQGSMLLQTWRTFSTVKQEEAKLYQEVSYWQDITKKFANYRDGYFSLAVLYYRLGNDLKAKENIEKVLSIDPRFEQGIALAQMLN